MQKNYHHHHHHHHQVLLTAVFPSFRISQNCLISHSIQTPEHQPAALGFHNNHGILIVLSDNQLTAKKTIPRCWGSGMVMSPDPMQVNKLYEVKSVRVSDRRAAAAASS